MASDPSSEREVGNRTSLVSTPTIVLMMPQTKHPRFRMSIQSTCERIAEADAWRSRHLGCSRLMFTSRAMRPEQTERKRMASDFTGLVAIVTGGASGIGAAIARRLSADGARVAVFDLASHAPAADLAVRVDVSDDESVVAGVRRVVEEFG